MRKVLELQSSAQRSTAGPQLSFFSAVACPSSISIFACLRDDGEA